MGTYIPLLGSRPATRLQAWFCLPLSLGRISLSRAFQHECSFLKVSCYPNSFLSLITLGAAVGVAISNHGLSDPTNSISSLVPVTHGGMLELASNSITFDI